VLIRAIFQTGQILETGLYRVTEPLPGTGLPQAIRLLWPTGLVTVPEHNLPPGKIMYMPEETVMYTEEIIMEMFNNEAMANGAAATDLQTGLGVSNK
jgi:hypothetical protein